VHIHLAAEGPDEKFLRRQDSQTNSIKLPFFLLQGSRGVNRKRSFALILSSYFFSYSTPSKIILAFLAQGFYSVRISASTRMRRAGEQKPFFLLVDERNELCLTRIFAFHPMGTGSNISEAI
jgi:hypothetical protein